MEPEGDPGFCLGQLCAPFGRSEFRAGCGRSTPPSNETDAARVVNADRNTGSTTDQPSAQAEMQARLGEGIRPPVRGANGIGL